MLVQELRSLAGAMILGNDFGEGCSVITRFLIAGVYWNQELTRDRRLQHTD
jgi:hypothetical protein